MKLKSPKYGEKIVLVDKDDFVKVNKLHWCISFVRGNWYAIHSAFKDGKSIQIKMHRFVMEESNPSIKIDHRNHNGLDNRKQNLRRSTIAQNTRNTGLTKRNKTGFKGVYQYKAPNKNAGRFTACLKIDGIKIFGGYFNTAIEAADKYNKLAKKYHGEFACLNKIDKNKLYEAREIKKEKKQRIRQAQSSLKNGFYGVTRGSGIRKRPFRASLRLGNKKTITIGYFEEAIDAAKAYNESAITYFGNKAVLNEMPNE